MVFRVAPIRELLRVVCSRVAKFSAKDIRRKIPPVYLKHEDWRREWARVQSWYTYDIYQNSTRS
jgi:hypothetical protein